MGGTGSGWRPRRTTVEEAQSIDVRRWARDGLLSRQGTATVTWWRGKVRTDAIDIAHDPDAVLLLYRVGEKRITDEIAIERTRCEFGGSRPWFLCPRCGRRAAKLYRPAYERHFRCRQCQGLTFASQYRRDDPGSVARRKAAAIWRRLGGTGFHDGIPPRPRGMRLSVYHALVDEALTYEEQATLASAVVFGKVDGLLARSRVRPVRD